MTPKNWHNDYQRLLTAWRAANANANRPRKTVRIHPDTKPQTPPTAPRPTPHAK